MSIQNNVVGPVAAQQTADPYGALRNFEVLKKLGHGHFSVVYSAKNRYNGMNVALKRVEVRDSQRLNILIFIINLSFSFFFRS